jgi:hypothetical protein
MALTDNLVSYWKLDESSGNASDSVGSRTLTNVNTITYSAGKINNGANFVTSSSQYFTFTPIGLSNTSFSIAGWFKIGTNQEGMIYSEGISGSANPFISIGRAGGTGSDWELVARDGSSVGLVSQFTAEVTRNVWHHFVWTMTTTQSKLYSDGVLIRTDSFTANSFTANVGRIGDRKRINEENYFGGSLDEIGVWTRVLSADEVSQLFNSGRANAYSFTATPSLYGGVSYWKFDESSGDAYDSVSSNTLVNTGTATFASAKINNGLTLNGTNQHLRTASTVLASGTAVSVSVWLKNGSASQGIDVTVFSCQNDNSGGFFVAKSTSGSGNEYSLVYSNGTAYQGFGTGTFAISTSNWEHYVFIINGNARYVYRNGVQIVSDTLSGNISLTTASRLTLGNYPLISADRWWNGRQDEFGIWSRALSSTEVTALYNLGNGLQYPFTATSTGNFFLII